VFTSDNGGIADPDSRNVAGAIEAGLAVNGPLRAGKHSIYEGGFREPFLVRWPGHVPAGTVSEQVIGLVDVFATLADILGVGRPPRGAEDSVSVLRAFTEAEPGPPVRDHVVMQGADATYALRMGDWKLIERVGAPPFEPRPRKKAPKHAPDAPRQDELFNLREDPSEQANLAADHPDRVNEMKRVLSAVRDRGATRPPNVLVILADDLGYGELGCQGYQDDFYWNRFDDRRHGDTYQDYLYATLEEVAENDWVWNVDAHDHNTPTKEAFFETKGKWLEDFIARAKTLGIRFASSVEFYKEAKQNLQNVWP